MSDAQDVRCGGGTRACGAAMNIQPCPGDFDENSNPHKFRCRRGTCRFPFCGAPEDTVMKLRKTLLASSIFAALCFAGVVQAQDQGGTTAQTTDQKPQSANSNKTDQGTPQELEAITVTGIRQSLKASLVTKRYANATIDAITAEDIGKLPATNVAEALAQMPGVTLDRHFGATQRVSIDGMDPSLNVTFLEGHPVAQAVWRYGDNPDRGFNFSLLPAEILGAMEIYKSPEARLPEGSLGGTIMMHTIQPLDIAPDTFSGSVGYNYNDMTDSGKPNVSVFYSWRDPDKTFGVDVSAQHYEQVTDREGEEIFGYTPVSTIAATNPAVAAQVESGAIKSTDMMPNEINSAFFQQTEKRDSITSNIQIKPNDNFEAGLGLMYIRDNLSNWNQSMYAFPMWLSSTVAGITSLTEGPGGVISGGHNCDPSTDATCPGAGGTVFDNQVRHSVVTTKGADLHATFRGARWQLSGQVGVSTSRTPSTQAFIEPVYFGGYTWDINKG